MTYDHLIKHYGSTREAAYKLGYTEQAVKYWKERGVPIRVQKLISILTEGKLKVSRGKK